MGGNLWRTTGDLTDVWSNMAAVGFRQDDTVKWSRPGHWTDPDMLVIGKVGWGPNLHDTRLTPGSRRISGTFDGAFTAKVPAHGVVLVTVQR